MSATATRTPPVKLLGNGLRVNLSARVGASYTFTCAATPASVPTAKIGLVVVCTSPVRVWSGAGPSGMWTSFGGVTNSSAAVELFVTGVVAGATVGGDGIPVGAGVSPRDCPASDSPVPDPTNVAGPPTVDSPARALDGVPPDE